MKKFISIVCMMMFSLYACIFVSAASVSPIRYEGNDVTDYDPPVGCFWYKIDGTDVPGTYMIMFDKEGQLNQTGPYRFAVTIDQENEECYTKVLCWKSNIPIYGVIVRGGDAFNLYQYSTSVTSDKDLAAPDIDYERPADVCHVSVVICPSTFPIKTTATTTPTTTSPPSGLPYFCIFSIILALLIIIFCIFIFLFIPKIWCRFCKSSNKMGVNVGNNTDIDIDNKIDYDKDSNDYRKRKDYKKDSENDSGRKK